MMKRTIRKVKKPDNSSKLVLKEIIGLSTTNSNGLASSVSSSRCAYVAGCVVVVYDVDSGAQSHLMVSHRMPRLLSCVAVSKDGRFIAAGESGTQPAVLVWDVETLALVYELKGHLFGVGCIAFSPDGRHLVSVGGYIHLWEWRIGMLVTKLKASASCSAISSVSFSSDAKFVITAGKKHLMFWTVRSSPKTRLSKGNVSMTMHGKAVNLGLQQGRSFISVTSSLRTDKTTMCGLAGEFFPLYALTDAGVLCLIHSGLSVRKSVDLKVDKGFAVSVSDKLIACACSSGIVRLFTIETLKYAGSLSYSKDKKGGGIGNNDIFCPNKDVETDFQLLPNLPDAVACQFMMSEKLVVIYGDHSLYIWNIHDVNQATRCYVLLSHSACIWDVKNLCCDNLHDQSLACVARGCSGGVSFATCSTDGSIRLWDLSFQPNPSEDLADHHPLNTESMSTTRLVSTGTFERDAMELGFSAQGFRSMAVSPDGKYLAAGDSKGSLHIYDLHTFDYTCFQDAHDSEILSLSFSLSSKKHVDSKEVTTGHYFLASGGRDQLIHLYDVRRNFDLIESIDDHSAAVTSVKLACNGHKILSSAADRSLVFRDISVTDNGFQISHRLHQMVSHGTVYDMVVDPKSEIAVTVGQDKKINTFDIASGRLIRSFKQNKYSGDPIKVTMDPSCSYLVCSDSNKSLYIYDFITGEMVTQVMGHGEVITGVIFLPDCKHIISVGGDGCIFVWQVPSLLSSIMRNKMKEKCSPLSPRSLTRPVGFDQINFSKEDQQCKNDSRDLLSSKNCEIVGKKEIYEGSDTEETLEFKFSVSRLPRWARARVTSTGVVPREVGSTSPQKVEYKNVSPLVTHAGGYAVCSPEAQIPSDHNMGITEACPDSSSMSYSYGNDNCSSPSTQGTISSFATDKHWTSVYTVCLLNSPNMQDVEDRNMLVSSQNLLQGRSEIPSNGLRLFGLENQIMDERNGHVSDKHACFDASKSMHKRTDHSGLCNVSECHETTANNVQDVVAELSSDGTGCRFHTTIDAHDMKSEESDLFKKHFGSLSSIDKIERGNSSKRRRHSGCYTVHRNYIGGCRRLLNSPFKDIGGKTLICTEETLEDLTFQVLDEQKNTDSCKQDPKVTVKSLNTLNQLVEVGEQKECASGGTEGKEKVIASREALLALDAAAENAVQVFSELQSLASGNGISNRHGQLHAEAAGLLPSIVDKVNAVAKFVQQSLQQ